MFKRFINKIKFSYEISFLGATLFFRIKLFVINLWLPFKKRFFLKNKSLYLFKLKKYNKIFSCYLFSFSDFAVLYEIFIKNEYDMQINEDPEVIFDLGANIGLSVIYFKLKFPNSKILAFEPDSKTFLNLKKNTEMLNGVKIFNFAISDRNGKEKFYINPDSSMSSSLIKRNKNYKPVDMEVRSIDSVLKEFEIKKIDILKFDIEGKELEIFETFNNKTIVEAYVGELHLDLIKGSKEDFLGIFREHYKIIFKKETNRRIVLEMYKK